MSNPLVVVKAARDEEVGVWFVESSDLAGLNAEADTLEELIQKLPEVVRDLLEENGLDNAEGADVPIELIAHASTRTRVHDAA
jgi:predicted RNase H-like HicB family nuclease